MQAKHITISIPTDDLERAYQFYLKGLDFKLVTEIPDGSRPEPVIFALAADLNLMLVPSDGFDSIMTPGSQVAKPGVSECVLSISFDSVEDVNAFIERAKKAGATIPEAPHQKPWGYIGYLKDLDGHLWMAIHER